MTEQTLTHPVKPAVPVRLYIGTVPESIKLPKTVQEIWDQAHTLYTAWEALHERTKHLFVYAEQPFGWDSTDPAVLQSGYKFAADAEATKADDALMLDRVTAGASDTELATVGTPNLDAVRKERAEALSLLKARADAVDKAQADLKTAMRPVQETLIGQASKAVETAGKAVDRAFAALSAAEAERDLKAAHVAWAESVCQETNWFTHWATVEYPPASELYVAPFVPREPIRAMNEQGVIVERFGMF